jgi:2-polyprenyl-3-methyl-5-hydroxy-6-metoxy-1,4-benzoquinol methylase
MTWQGNEWEKWGQRDPYFAVITRDDYHADRVDDGARRVFFAGGEDEIAMTVEDVRRVTSSDWRPNSVLDFGCGVGRLTIPLARISERICAVDVSPAMLREAARNCEDAGLRNVDFRLSTPGLTGVEGPFDFVHSSIVFQHIPPSSGYALFDAILDRVTPNGAGMLHVVHGQRGSPLRTAAHRARRSSRVIHRLLNVIQRRPIDAPLMAMFEYELSRLLVSLQTRGFERIGGRLTDHGGWLGVMLTFSRGDAGSP